MKFRMYGMLTASLGAVALLLTANQTFAGARGGFHGGAHPISHHVIGHFHHHHGPEAAVAWPGDGYFNGYGPNGEAVMDGIPPLPRDVSNSNAADIPWDWAHRYPPAVVPSTRPYVSSCGAETLMVPDQHGGTREVNIVRCY